MMEEQFCEVSGIKLDTKSPDNKYLKIINKLTMLLASYSGAFEAIRYLDIDEDLKIEIKNSQELLTNELDAILKDINNG